MRPLHLAAVLLCALAALGVLWTPAAAADAPTATKTVGGLTFTFYKQKLSWPAARAYCEDQGGSLATVTSAEQDQLIVSTCMNTLIGQVSSGDHGCWIGLSDGEEEGSYTWVDGRPMSYSGWYRGDWTEPNDATSVSLRARKPVWLSQPRVVCYSTW